MPPKQNVQAGYTVKHGRVVYLLPHVQKQFNNGDLVYSITVRRRNGYNRRLLNFLAKDATSTGLRQSDFALKYPSAQHVALWNL